MIGWVNAAGAAIRVKTNTTVRRAGRIRLLTAVILALGAGLAVALIAYQVLRRVTPTSNAAAAPIDLTKVALTVVAGVGGVVALVIAYRRQRDLEQSRFVERFGAAAAQLGDTDVAVRIAGAYAMAGVADESDGLRRQQCIDVLCGYLRLPHSPSLGGNHQTKEIRTYPSGEPSAPGHEQHFEYRQNDREVRDTIVRVIADRLKPGSEYSWSTSDFDFRTAHLEDVDFNSAVFAGLARFDRVTFRRDAWFDNAHFGSNAWFREATFVGDAGFRQVLFTGDARFDRTSFRRNAGFRQAVFTSDARFDKTTFRGDAWFDNATFTGNAGFREAKFRSKAIFHRVAFDDTSFSRATFRGEALFSGTTFGGDVGFGKATFAGPVRLDEATFHGDTWFGEATFRGDARFEKVTFVGEVGFRAVTFAGPARFTSAEFGSARVSFIAPRQWGPPAPEFDWCHDSVERPANIEPQEWPPALTPPQ